MRCASDCSLPLVQPSGVTFAFSFTVVALDSYPLLCAPCLAVPVTNFAVGGIVLTVVSLYVQVVAQLLGKEALPWENMSAEDRRKLGAFRGPIMQLLKREPSQRPTMPEFYHACSSIFSTSTTYTAGGNNSAMSSGNTGKVAQPRTESPAILDTEDLTRTMN